MENNKIPTAEEFFDDNKLIPFHTDSFHYKEIYKIMVEFAKLHVKAALKVVIEETPSGSSTDTVSYEDVVKVLKDCYPLKNIK